MVRLCCFFGVFSMIGLAGCGGGDGIVTVSGILTHKGKPVSSAMVTFSPETGRPSIGATDAEGRFKLRYDRTTDGVELGTHKVSIEFKPTTNAELEAVQLQGKVTLSKEQQALFDKYSHTNSKHKVKIDSSTRELKVELP